MNTLRTLTLANAASIALALSDGTPVEFVKVTSKDNIQVRVPTSHPLGSADPLRIFRRDGSHYKDQTSLTLTVANDATASAPAAVAANDGDTAAAPSAPLTGSATYTVGGNAFSSLSDAKLEAIDIFRDTGQDVDIIETVTRTVGRVGFVSLAA
jgi:hypothetical protein